MVRQISILLVICIVIICCIYASLTQHIPQQYTSASLPSGYYFILDNPTDSKCPKITHQLKPKGALLGPCKTIADLYKQQHSCLDQLHFQFTHIPL